MSGLRTRCPGVIGVAALIALAACSPGQPETAETPSSAAATSTSASPTPDRPAPPKKSPSKKTRSEKSTQQPRQVSSDPITGGSKKLDAPVVAVKIDNVAAARPQVGVGAADMVVVERVEGNLTRLMGIYHSRFPDRVGPVRSARNTDLQLLPMFGHPALVFSGANGKVLRQVRKAPVRAVERSDRDPDRIAPHNVIVDLGPVSKLRGLRAAEPVGYTFSRSGDGWRTATADRAFGLRVGSDRFGFRWDRGHYRTSWNGRPSKDADSGRQVVTDNVVRLAVRSPKDTRTTSDESEVMQTVGAGRATVHSRGKRIEGRWSRPKKSAPMRLTDRNGRQIALSPGRTWIVLDG